MLELFFSNPASLLELLQHTIVLFIVIVP